MSEQGDHFMTVAEFEKPAFEDGSVADFRIAGDNSPDDRRPGTASEPPCGSLAPLGRPAFDLPGAVRWPVLAAGYGYRYCDLTPSRPDQFGNPSLAGEPMIRLERVPAQNGFWHRERLQVVRTFPITPFKCPDVTKRHHAAR